VSSSRPYLCRQYFEWKAGAPYAGAIKPPIAALLFSGAHGKATLSEGPTKDTTTVSIESRLRPGNCCPCCVPVPLVQAALKGLSAKAPERFKQGLYLGPQTMQR
tara:strand:- start:513 stop:824 length:312 start_codon:yes stop_codon:yes gene_type:complete